MTTLPEAMRLADALKAATGQTDAEDDVIHVARWFVEDAAAELRRLHQFAEDQIGRATAAEAALQMTKATHALKIAAVEAQRDALLEALETGGWNMTTRAITTLRAALAQQAEPVAGKVVAWGIFALTDGEWELQHPVFVGDECGKENAECERASYSGPQPLEVRPLGVVTATAQRKPLTDEELDRLWREPMSADWEHREFARAVELAHGIGGKDD